VEDMPHSRAGDHESLSGCPGCLTSCVGSVANISLCSFTSSVVGGKRCIHLLCLAVLTVCRDGSLFFFLSLFPFGRGYRPQTLSADRPRPPPCPHPTSHRRSGNQSWESAARRIPPRSGRRFLRFPGGESRIYQMPYALLHLDGLSAGARSRNDPRSLLPVQTVMKKIIFSIVSITLRGFFLSEAVAEDTRSDSMDGNGALYAIAGHR